MWTFIVPVKAWREGASVESASKQALFMSGSRFLHASSIPHSVPHLSPNRVDASRAIGAPWPNPTASNERLASLRWLARPSFKFSKPMGSPRPMTFMHTSPANSMRPGRHNSATCPAQCPGA
jgi:hypothetical protein